MLLSEATSEGQKFIGFVCVNVKLVRNKPPKNEKEYFREVRVPLKYQHHVDISKNNIKCLGKFNKNYTQQ